MLGVRSADAVARARTAPGCGRTIENSSTWEAAPSSVPDSTATRKRAKAARSRSETKDAKSRPVILARGESSSRAPAKLASRMVPSGWRRK